MENVNYLIEINNKIDEAFDVGNKKELIRIMEELYSAGFSLESVALKNKVKEYFKIQEGERFFDIALDWGSMGNYRDQYTANFRSLQDQYAVNFRALQDRYHDSRFDRVFYDKSV